MNITTRFSKAVQGSYTSISFNSMSADTLAELLLSALREKERRYTKCLAKLKPTDNYYLLCLHIVNRCRRHILEIECGVYEHTCKMQDRLEKGNV